MMRALHPRYWFLYLGIVIAWLWVKLLPYKILMSVGRLLGLCFFYLSGRRRKIGLRNLEACFPKLTSQARYDLLKKSFGFIGQGFAEMLMAWWMPTFRLKKLRFIIQEGREAVLRIANPHQGMVLCCAHFTCMEMVGCLFGLEHKNLYLVYQKHKDPIVNKIINAGRRRYAAGLIERKDMKSMVKVLKEGNYLFYAPDQDLGRRRTTSFIDFFNIPCATITALGSLLKAGEAQGCLSFFYREGEYYGGQGILLDSDLNNLNDSGEYYAKQYNRALEKAILAHPDQYLWIHRRFKTRPEGEGKFYDV